MAWLFFSGILASGALIHLGALSVKASLLTLALQGVILFLLACVIALAVTHARRKPR